LEDERHRINRETPDTDDGNHRLRNRNGPQWAFARPTSTTSINRTRNNHWDSELAVSDAVVWVVLGVSHLNSQFPGVQTSSRADSESQASVPHTLQLSTITITNKLTIYSLSD
jgi:hypothetical protein